MDVTRKIKKTIFIIGIAALALMLIGVTTTTQSIVMILGIINGENENGNDDVQDVEIDLDGMPPWVTNEILVTSLQLQEKYGIYASVTIAQAQQEVGGTWDGTSLYNTASKEYNLFGLKATGTGSTWKGEVTWDGTRGATGTYRKYTSYSQGLKDRARLLLTSSAYKNIAETARKRSGSQAQLEALSKSPWCENQYNTLNMYMKKFNLSRLDHMTVAGLFNTSGAGGGSTGGQDLKHATKKQKKVYNVAMQGSLFGCHGGQCQKWVATVYQKALGGRYKSICCAHNGWMTWGVSTSTKNIPIGATVYNRGSGKSGSCHALLGHVGIYVGNGMVVSNTGVWKKQTLASFVKNGWFGWGWNAGEPLN